MKSFVFVVVLIGVCGVFGGPAGGRRRGGRDGEVAADVIPVSDDKTPIVTDTAPSAAVENEVVPRQQNETASASQPTPVPSSVPITTEQLPAENTPSLVPSVVDISTPDPNNTPAPTNLPSNSTSGAGDEDDEESDEENSDEEEEAEEGDNNEGSEEDEEEDDEEDDDEEDEEDEEDDLGRKVVKKSEIKKVSKRDVVNAEEVAMSALEHETKTGSVIIPPAASAVAEERTSDEEGDEVATTTAGSSLKSASNLQAVPANSPTNEDDEVDISNNGSNANSVILS